MNSQHKQQALLSAIAALEVGQGKRKRKQRNRKKKAGQQAVALLKQDGRLLQRALQVAGPERGMQSVPHFLLPSKRTRVAEGRQRRELNSYLDLWMKQIMRPESVRGGSPVLAPAQNPSRAQANHLRREYTFGSVATPIPAGFIAKVRPTLYPVQTTAIMPLPFAVPQLNIEGFLGAQGNIEGEGRYGDNAGSGDGSFNELFITHVVPVDGKQAFAVGGHAGDLIDFGTMGYPANDEFTMWLHETPGGWANMGTFLTGSWGVGNNIATITAAADFDAVTLTGVVDKYEPGLIQGAFFKTSAVAGFVVESQPQHLSPINLDLPAGAERYRLSAEAILLTFFGADIQNQGAVAICRAYPGWTPFDNPNSSPFDNIANLPFQSYDGAAKVGAHGFWLPSKLSEYDFRDAKLGAVANDIDLTTIWIALKGMDPTAEMRLELDTVIEFYSNLDYYTKEPCPYYSDACGQLMYAIGLQECVGDNPGHIARIAKAAKSVASIVNTGAKVVGAFM